MEIKAAINWFNNQADDFTAVQLEGCALPIDRTQSCPGLGVPVLLQAQDCWREMKTQEWFPRKKRSGLRTLRKRLWKFFIPPHLSRGWIQFPFLLHQAPNPGAVSRVEKHHPAPKQEWSPWGWHRHLMLGWSLKFQLFPGLLCNHNHIHSTQMSPLHLQMEIKAFPFPTKVCWGWWGCDEPENGAGPHFALLFFQVKQLL